MSEQETYFIPKVEKGTPLAIDKKTTDYEPDLAALGGEDGVIEMKLESSVVMERLAKDIYKDYKSGFREIYANAVSASMVSTRLFNAKPRIEIEVNPNTREFILREFDSIGMTPEVFKDVYTVIGRSGNFDGTRPGQFGFGRLAWVTLSDRMVLQTRYRTTDGKTGMFAVEGQNGKSFVVLPKPNIKAFGTSVKLFLYDKIDIYTLIEYIKNACEFSKVDTYLTLVSSVRYGGNQGDDSDNDYTAAKTFEKGTTKLTISYHDKALKLASSHSYNPYSINKEILLNGEGWEAYGAFTGVLKGKLLANDQFVNNTYLLGLPIDAKFVSPYNIFIVNILDERKFQPTADRERLKDESEEKLRIEIEDATRQAFSPVRATTLTEYMSLPAIDRQMINAGGPGDRPDSIGYYLDEATYDFAQTINTAVPYRTKNTVTSSGPRYSLNDSLSNILAAVQSMDQVFISRGRFVGFHCDTIVTINPDAIMISCFERPEVYDLLTKAGARSLTDYINNLPNKTKVKRVYKNATAYTRRGIVHEIDDKTIKIHKDTPLDAYRLILDSQLAVDYSFAVDKPIAYTGRGVSIEDFVSSVENTALVTNKGPTTIGKLPTKNILLVRLTKTNLIPLLESSHYTIIFSNDDDLLFKVATYLTFKGWDFDYDLDGDTATEALRKAVMKLQYYRDHKNADEILTQIATICIIKNHDLAILVSAGFDSNYYEKATDLLNRVLEIPEILDHALIQKLHLEAAGAEK
nr:hypothetical protein [Ferrimicrobium acidiphilum]